MEDRLYTQAEVKQAVVAGIARDREKRTDNLVAALTRLLRESSTKEDK